MDGITHIGNRVRCHHTHTYASVGRAENAVGGTRPEHESLVGRAG